MHPESSLLPISALQHLLFCERQCALIHVERVWVENRFTAEGRILHRKAHDGKPETRDGVRTTRGLPVHSFELGLVGQCDVVTWQPPAGEPSIKSAATLRQRILARLAPSPKPSPADGGRKSVDGLPPADNGGGLAGWTITPVEYKRGRPKKNDCDRVQLCAQAMCLEEMLGASIAAGDLFYGKHRRHFDVPFDASLRQATTNAARRLHELIASGITPRAVREKKCDTCSLLPICLPDSFSRQSARTFFERRLAKSMAEE